MSLRHRPWAMALLLALLFVLVDCTAPPTRHADVKLSIDGQRFDYATDRAQVDQQERGGGYSVYLRPAGEDETHPYLCLRRYSGNPVAALWLRYRKPATELRGGGALDKYDCYVPGALSDGRPTLGWAKPDGSPRDRTETGERHCVATTTVEGGRLELRFDATLHLDRPVGRHGKADRAGGGQRADTVSVSGSASLKL